ncbi:MAG: adenylate/guanylate cyclase domain-containing protein [Betaproteobacteria bacterium]
MRICVSVSSKLLIMLCASGISAALVVGTISYFSADQALRNSISDQLVSIRETKKADISRYFDGEQRTFSVFSRSGQLVDATAAFRGGFASATSQVDPSARASLEAFYRDKFLPKVPDHAGTATIGEYWPRSSAGIQLQSGYIAANPAEDGHRFQLGLNGELVAGVGSYSDVHNRYHPWLVKAMEGMKLYDLFLVDADNGDVLYTVQKEADFATNLENGPYRNSGLARAFRAARDNHVDATGTVLVDFEKYRASFDIPSSFVAAPVIADGKTVAVVIGQLSIDDLNATLTSSGHWKSEGLGKTGEVYLVGSDGTSRSDSRFLIEDKEAYLKTLASLDVPQSTIAAIKSTGHSILNQKFATAAVKRALDGETGADNIRDYRGEAVLSAYAPLDVGGMRWAIIAEKDVAEALEPVYTLRMRVSLATGVMAILITLFSMFGARFFLGPIARLQAGVQRLRGGETHFKIPIIGTDEFEELGKAFNEMLGELDERNQVIATKTNQYEKLLRNILPEAVADRVSGGEMMVADTFDNVSVIYATIRGLNSIITETSAKESIGLLNELVDAFDEAAERHGVEKVKTMGDAYLAACGLSMPRLDHRQRARAFAEEMIAILARFNEAKGFNLVLQMGLAFGEVDAGIVGRKRFVYELLGDCVAEARRLAFIEGQPGINLSEAMAAELDGGNDGPSSQPTERK